jgi:hypothetical protein
MVVELLREEVATVTSRRKGRLLQKQLLLGEPLYTKSTCFGVDVPGACVNPRRRATLHHQQRLQTARRVVKLLMQ